MTTMPEPRCYECDALLELDGDDGACYYTGRACAPGGCDCGTRRTTLCPDCQAEPDPALAAAAERLDPARQSPRWRGGHLA